jgi:hypothetical protein
MVEDFVFYIVLGLLIAVIALFVFMMYKIKQQFSNPLMGAVMTSLHASLFGYESAMIDMIGSRGYKSHVFPKIVQIIKENAKSSPLLEEFVKSKDKFEAMQKWMEILKKAGISKDGIVTHDETDDSYIIDIPHCMLCDPIHNLIGDTKGICPMALILTAAGTVGDSSVEAQIEYSKFIPTGTVTKVKFIKATN